MYNATITSKEIQNGKLIVGVSFENGIDTFAETFETTQQQGSTWIGEMISNRLKHLASLDSLKNSIETGPYTLPPEKDPSGEEYQQKANEYLKYMAVARHGFIRSDYAKITELREWLRDNFKEEYISLF